MLARRVESRSQSAVSTRPGSTDWQHEHIHSTVEMAPVIEAVTATMTQEGYPEKDVFAMRMALEEAIVNSIKHGHRYDPSKQVRVSYRIDSQRVLVQTEDQGPGFDPHQVADPCAFENLDRPCGRGLLLMRHYVTWLRYSPCGNGVTLCKCRTDEERPNPRAE